MDGPLWGREPVVRHFLPSLIVLLAMLAVAYADGDSLVRAIEMREGVAPGGTRVIPDCSCTVRYLGTTVHGNRYTITLEKLD